MSTTSSHLLTITHPSVRLVFKEKNRTFFFDVLLTLTLFLSLSGSGQYAATVPFDEYKSFYGTAQLFLSPTLVLQHMHTVYIFTHWGQES